MIGLLDKNGNSIWNGKFIDGTPGFVQGIGDIDGDGQLELISPGHQVDGSYESSKLHVYKAATGKLLWTMPLPGRAFTANIGVMENSPTPSITADIDGDGREEAIFGIGKELFAIGATPDGKAGRIVWKISFDANIGTPAMIDANGDGQPEIIVICENGYVYGIGNAE